MPRHGDFHQLAGSPTIDAGSSAATLLGSFDLDGEARIQGCAPDIGADEFPDALCPLPEPEAGDGTPPDTTISRRPKDRTRKKRATFEFGSTEAGSTFQCSLDGEPFEPCSSPDTEKVKKGKHEFEVRATDAAGNTDPTPASDSWRVKKKRKR